MSETIIDDAGLWWENRNTPIQEYEVPAADTVPDSFLNLDETEAESEEPKKVTDSDVKTELNMIKLNEPTAEVIVTIMDIVFPIVITLLVKNVSKEDLKIDEDERETLTSAWAQYLKTSSFTLSPGGVLLASVVTIYGAKVAVASITKSKKNDELELLREQNAILKESITTAYLHEQRDK